MHTEVVQDVATHARGQIQMRKSLKIVYEYRGSRASLTDGGLLNSSLIDARSGGCRPCPACRSPSISLRRSLTA
ncbi:hypothetical protein RV134_320039 [Roseovarius sp. EC-HK134]|nr:hypothetical protein RV134_320039 [Roseovarius sp. EC-HK134]